MTIKLKMNTDQLQPSQKRALLDLRSGIEQYCQSQDPDDGVLAVTGARGWGKTTLLERIREGLSGSSNVDGNRIFLVTHVVDATSVDVGLGIMAECIRKLWDLTCSKYNPMLAGREPDQDLKDLYQKCFRMALDTGGASFRQMARDMAMSPNQYEQILQQGAMKRSQIETGFKCFLERLSDFIQQGACEAMPVFVIFIDDLDLANSKMVKTWTNAMIKYYRNPRLMWVLSFDRGRLIGQLSNKSTIHPTEKDLNTGNALLTKLAAYHRQYSLEPWGAVERMGFYPFKGDQNKTLHTLFERAGKTQMLPLLPKNPRGLVGIYRWLDQNLPAGDDVSEDAVSDQGLLVKLAEVNNLPKLLQLFEIHPPEQLATTFKWQVDGMHDTDWNSAVKMAKTTQPIYGFPLPEGLESKIGEYSGEAFSEAICNAGLKTATITPYQLLRRMPFTRERLDRCQTAYRVREDEITHFFNSGDIGRHLLWGYWEGDDDKGIWDFVMGPEAFWKSLLQYRDPLPTHLRQKLYLYGPTFDADLMADFDESREVLTEQHLLPSSLRALMLLVDALNRAPWLELQVKRSLWNPLTLAQCSAAFQLAALAYAIWPDQVVYEALKQGLSGLDTEIENPPTLYFPLEPLSTIYSLTEDDIDLIYANMVEVLSYLDLSSMEADLKDNTLQIRTRREIHEMLTKILALPAVTKLRLPPAPAETHHP